MSAEPEPRPMLAIRFANVMRIRAAKIGRDPLLLLAEAVVAMDRKAVEDFVAPEDGELAPE